MYVQQSTMYYPILQTDRLLVHALPPTSKLKIHNKHFSCILFIYQRFSLLSPVRPSVMSVIFSLFHFLPTYPDCVLLLTVTHSSHASSVKNCLNNFVHVTLYLLNELIKYADWYNIDCEKPRYRVPFQS